MAVALSASLPAQAKRLNPFERYLSLWVILCIGVGVLLGRAFPVVVSALRSTEFGRGEPHQSANCCPDLADDHPDDDESGFRLPYGCWPTPRWLLVTLFVNWLVKPFSMAFFAWVFFRVHFRCLANAGRSGSIHRRLYHSGGRTLYRDGLRLELSHGWRSCLYAGPSDGERSHNAGSVCSYHWSSRQ